jgi:hypothetical protein
MTVANETKAIVYDGDLQMFVDPPREIDERTALFYRWLVEQDMVGVHGNVQRPERT